MIPPEIIFDDALRDHPKDVAYTRSYVGFLKKQLLSSTGPLESVKALGVVTSV